MRRGTVFYKMSGSGNDFVLLDGRHTSLDEVSGDDIRALCDRRLGVGADGVILLAPGGPEGAHFTFHFWNSDGSLGPMCGNGALCATRLATLIELAPPGDVRFATEAGLHLGRVVDDRAEIQLPDCARPRKLTDARLEAGEPEAWLVNPSVPHLVVPVDDVSGVPLERRGPPLRNDPAAGPGGANVNWVSPTGNGGFRMRTYERGVEAETLACGTGAVACALVLEGQARTTAPVRIWTRSGMPLDIAWTRSGDRITGIALRGEGRLVFRGALGSLVSDS